MTIIVWRILCLVSMALFIIGLFTLLFTRLLKNKYYHNFSRDELMRKTDTANSKNYIYFTSGETKKFIKKYVYAKTAFDKFLVCNFTKSFQNITYFVMEYTRHGRVISVKQVKEYNTGDTSKVIALNKRCAYVNVVIGCADGLEVNSNVIRPLSLTKIRLYAFLKSFTIFLGLFWVRHVLIEVIGGAYMKFYLTDLMNYIAVGASFIFALLSYFITVLCFRRKNVKALNGGVLEYEFV